MDWTEEGEQLHIMWSFVMMADAEPVGGEGSGVGVGGRLKMMDDAETVGGEGSAVGIGEWLMDDDLAAEVVSITSSQCNRDEYHWQPALVQALLGTPGSIPHPAAHREVCRTQQSRKGIESRFEHQDNQTCI